MSATLVPCSSCSRHVRADSTACPFCAAALNPTSGPMQAARVAVALAAALTASASLAACYGGPPHPQMYQPPPHAADAGTVLVPNKP